MSVKFVCAPVLAALALCTGCSADTAKRTAYETMQNVRQQECLKTPGADCGKHGDYEDYQRQRRELQQSD